MLPEHELLKRRWRSATSLLLLILVLPFLLACAGARIETRENVFVIEGGPAQLVVNNENGRIEVAATTGTTVRVTATIRNPGRVNYSVVQKGDTIEVTADAEGGFFLFRRSGGADITLSVPEQADLDLKSSNGQIVITGVQIPILATAETSNGAITLRQVQGIDEVGPATGSATLLPSIGLQTSNGRVVLEQVQGDVELRTSNGSVDIEQFLGQVNTRTSNGSIAFSGTLLPDSDNVLRTSNGSIEVQLVDTPGVEVDASTSNGRVQTTLPVTVTGEIKRERLRGTIGEGGRSLRLETSNGNITIR